MRAAEKLFTSRRFHEVTLDDVVQAAGVGKGTVYRHFKDKEDLFFQVVTAGFEEMRGLLSRHVRDGAPAAEQLLDACREISAFYRKRRQLFGMMQAEAARMLGCRGAIREQWTAQRRNLVGAMAAIIRRGVAEGQLRDDIDPEVLATYLLGMLRTRARDLADASEPMQRHEMLVDLFCRGAGRNGRPVAAGDGSSGTA